ncbi:phage holin family protein [Nocardioides hwasunensis]|uniref:Phage holin family protein n=1 Tax=Nocardioides hwasunensis TaxID=397258 RepID=A0ABR8MIT4_9ACTN|nr:phage holin family protein [Nocardioides hwasunensis]MBD3915490.1 phage holin family protein [Nocardioides hwasunensis]
MANEPIKDTDPTLGKLVMDAQRDISTLVSQEIQLAKSELKVSVRHGGLGIGLFAAAAFLLLLAVIMLSVSIAYFIHWAGLGLHWSFLIVFGLYVLVAAVLGLIGLRQVKQVKAPERAIKQGKQIPGALKGKG